MISENTFSDRVCIDIKCDSCGLAVLSIGSTREQANKFIYDEGFRANFNARKYVHLCAVCGPKIWRKRK